MQLLSKTASPKLIIELSKSAISAVAINQGSQRLTKVLVQTSEEQVNFADTANLAGRLSNTVRLFNTRGPVAATVCIPRSVTCLHVVELPRIDIRDLASIVTLEMEAIYAEDCDQYVWDYVYVGTQDKTPAYANIICIPKRILNSVISAFDQAQIAIERITLAELGYGQDCSSQPVLEHIVAFRQSRVDVLVSYCGCVIQSHTLFVLPNQPCDFARIQGELRRLHSSLPESLQLLVPKSILLLARQGSIDEYVEPSVFEDSLVAACQVHDFRVEPFLLEEFFDFRSRPEKRVDLAHPRKATSPPISRRHKVALLMAVFVSISVVFWAINQYRSARVLDEIRATERKIEDSEKRIAALSPQLEAAALLSGWDESNVDWSQQISAISREVAESFDCYLVRIQMDNQNFQERSPVTRMEGRAKSSQGILQITRDLSAGHPWLSVHPNGIEPNSVDPEFSSQFRVEITEASQPDAAEPEQK